MKYLLEKALRDGKVVSSLNFFMWVHAQNVNYSRYIVSLTWKHYLFSWKWQEQEQYGYAEGAPKEEAREIAYV